MSNTGGSYFLASRTPSGPPKCRRRRLPFPACPLVATLILLWVTGATAQNLFVSNLYTESVWEWDPSGNLITSSIGAGLGVPQGLAFDHSGDLYLACYSYATRMSSIAKFGPGGNLLNPSFISVLGYAKGLAFDSAGNLYVANTQYGRIAKYGPTGNLINPAFASAPYPTFFSAWSMAFDRDDNLYVAAAMDDSVVKISPAGSVNLSFISGLAYPTGLTFDHSGNLYVANYYTGVISEYDTSGNIIDASFASTGQGYNVESLAFDASGNLYVGNNGNGVVMKFGPGGNLLNPSFASGGAGAEFIAFSVVIPEPPALALLALALPAVLHLHHRRSRAPSPRRGQAAG